MVLRVYVLLFCTFLVSPILIVIYVSFSPSSYVSVPITGVSLRWFWRIWEYKPFIQALGTSLQLAFLAGVLAAAVTTPAVLVMRLLPRRFSEVVEAAVLSPLAVPYIVIGCAALFFFSSIGLGVSFGALLLTHTVVSVPYTFRTSLAVYRSIGPGIEEAARSLGASRLETMTLIILPLIKPGLLAGFAFAALISLDNLPVSFFFGTPSTNTLPVVMLSYLENQFDPSIAALSTVQMIIAVILLMLFDRMIGVEKLFRSM